MKNLDLLNKALEVTTSNVTKKRGPSNKVTTNDRILKLLFENEDSKPLSRVEIVNHITFQRMEETLEREIIESDFENQEFLEKWGKLSKTVKNGVDSSISKSNNNSSFHFNKKYEDYLLVVDKENKYSIIEKDPLNEPINETPPTSKNIEPSESLNEEVIETIEEVKEEKPKRRRRNKKESK